MYTRTQSTNADLSTYFFKHILNTGLNVKFGESQQTVFKLNWTKSIFFFNASDSVYFDFRTFIEVYQITKNDFKIFVLPKSVVGS